MADKNTTLSKIAGHQGAPVFIFKTPRAMCYVLCAMCIFVLVFSCLNVASAATLTLPPNNLGLIGYWSFNEGTGGVATDFSGGGFAGTVYGSPVWVDGKNGKAIYFDGLNDYVHNTGNHTVSDITSISVWVKADNGGTIISSLVDTGVVSVDNPPSNGYDGYAIGYTSGTLSASLRASSYNPVLTLSSSMSVGVWHQVVFQWSSGDSKLYVDNVLEDSSVATFTFYNPSAIPETDIGRYNHLGTGYFTGIIDDVRVYNRFITLTEINNLYIKQSRSVKIKASLSGSKINVSQANKLTSGLVNYWSFDGPNISGTTITDTGTSGYNGTNNGASLVPGKVGQGLYFNGSESDYVNIASPTLLATQSTSFWIKADANSSTYFSSLKDTCPPNHDGYLFSYSAGTLSYIVYANDNNGEQTQLNIAMSANNWHHVVGTHTSGSIKLYLDGALVDSSTDTLSFCNPSAIPDTDIGRYDYLDNSYSTAYIDEIRIYNRILSVSEVQQLYNLGK